MTSPILRPLLPEDWPAVLQIYQEGIATGIATLQTEAPGWEEWDRAHAPMPRLVIETDAVVGWAALSPVSSRPVYAGVAEVSIYIASHTRGRGLGRHLLQALIDQSERAGYWTLQAAIFRRNQASAALHARCRFRLVGHRERLGALHGRWEDILLFERRSRTVGADP